MKEFSHVITEEEVLSFMVLTGDTNKIHWDTDRPIVHGMLVASFISRMIGTMLPGEGSVWSSADFFWLRPVYILDKIIVKAEILCEKGGFAEMQIDVHNHNEELVLNCHAWVKT